MALLRYDYGSRKLVGKGVSQQASLRSTVDPSLESDRALALLHLILGSLKLIEEGECLVTFLRFSSDPPLTGGGGSSVTLLWCCCGLRKLVGKGVLRLTFLC